MDRFQVIPAAYLLLVRGTGPATEVLLQRRGPETGYRPLHWASGAAGHVEYGESAAVAVAREAREEIGVGVDPARLTPLCVLQRTQPGVSDPVEQRVDFFLTAREWTGEPTVREPGKCLELRWCSPAAPPDPLVPHEAVVLRALSVALTGGLPVPPLISLGFG